MAQAGGTIGLDSAPARGTRVVIELPCREDGLLVMPRAEAPLPDESARTGNRPAWLKGRRP